MSKWKPSRRDDQRNARREFRKMKRGISEANKPSGSNVYETTDKLQHFDGSAAEALAVANQALAEAESLPSTAGTGIEIKNRTISCPDMTRGEVLSICTFSS